ncbi:MAG: TIGR04282 family arsenosugar biosynthesis glycosyltransferase [SAR324 cluster bacterium]
MAMCAERTPAPRVRLVVMSRAPVPGRTKTRLIPAFGGLTAAALHAACLADVLSEGAAWRLAGPGRGQERALTLCVAPGDRWPDFARAGIVLPPGAKLAVQQGETLGARMAGALHEALAGADAALLVGCDLPLLSRSHLEAAGAALLGGKTRRRADAVLGPAEDGGYYLIGVRRGVERWPELLDLEDWGTATVLQRTLARAGRIGLKVAQIDSLPDADTPADLARILRHPRAAAASLHRSVALARRLLQAPEPRGGPIEDDVR